MGQFNNWRPQKMIEIHEFVLSRYLLSQKKFKTYQKSEEEDNKDQKWTDREIAEIKERNRKKRLRRM
jgi:hypothetical protein